MGGEGGGCSVSRAHKPPFELRNLTISFNTGFVFLVHIQENLEDELVKEALEKVGNNALGVDFLWIQRYYAYKLPVTWGGGGRCLGGVRGLQPGVIFKIMIGFGG